MVSGLNAKGCVQISLVAMVLAKLLLINTNVYLGT